MGGEGHRRLRAAVVAVAQADHVRVAGELAGREDRDFVRLAAGVGEVRDGQIRFRRHVLGQLLAELPDRRVQIDRRRVLQLADLLANFLDDLRMAMADGDRDDAGEGVEILLARLVPHVLHVAFDDQQRIAVVRDQAGRQILLPQGEDFLFAGAVVGRWLVIADRQLGTSLSGHR